MMIIKIKIKDENNGKLKTITTARNVIINTTFNKIFYNDIQQIDLSNLVDITVINKD